jgi:hypothetical protein
MRSRSFAPRQSLETGRGRCGASLRMTGMGDAPPRFPVILREPPHGCLPCAVLRRRPKDLAGAAGVPAPRSRSFAPRQSLETGRGRSGASLRMTGRGDAPPPFPVVLREPPHGCLPCAVLRRRPKDLAGEAGGPAPRSRSFAPRQSLETGRGRSGASLRTTGRGGAPPRFPVILGEPPHGCLPCAVLRRRPKDLAGAAGVPAPRSRSFAPRQSLETGRGRCGASLRMTGMGDAPPPFPVILREPPHGCLPCAVLRRRLKDLAGEAGGPAMRSRSFAPRQSLETERGRSGASLRITGMGDAPPPFSVILREPPHGCLPCAVLRRRPKDLAGEAGGPATRSRSFAPRQSLETGRGRSGASLRVTGMGDAPPPFSVILREPPHGCLPCAVLRRRPKDLAGEAGVPATRSRSFAPRQSLDTERGWSGASLRMTGMGDAPPPFPVILREPPHGCLPCAVLRRRPKDLAGAAGVPAPRSRSFAPRQSLETGRGRCGASLRMTGMGDAPPPFSVILREPPHGCLPCAVLRRRPKDLAGEAGGPATRSRSFGASFRMTEGGVRA